MDLPAGYREKKTTAAPRVPGTPRYERQELIVKFLERINPSRVSARMKPYTYTRMAKELEKIPDGDLRWLYKQCEGARNFAALFFHILKEDKKKAV